MSCVEIVSVNGKSPLPRSGHKIVADDKYVYLIGGYVELSHPSRNEVKGEIWRYHILSGIWKKLKFHTDEFHLAASHSCAKIGDFIYITGGTGLPFGVNILNSLILVDVRNNIQRLVNFKPKNNEAKNRPIATYGHSMIVLGSSGIDWPPCLLIFGGTTGTTYHNQVYKIDLSTMESELINDGDNRRNYYSGDDNSMSGPSGRYKHETFLFNNDVYMLGGATASDCCLLTQIHIFSLQDYKWRMKNTCGIDPGSLRCPSMCQNGKYIYLTGGLITETNTVSQSIFLLDLEKLQWSNIGQWSTQPTYFHDSCFIHHLGRIMMFGGVSQVLPTQKRSNRLYSITPSHGNVIKPLQELAWQNYFTTFVKPDICNDNNSYSSSSSSSSSVATSSTSPYNVINVLKVIKRLFDIGIPCQFLYRISPDFDNRGSFAA